MTHQRILLPLIITIGCLACSCSKNKENSHQEVSPFPPITGVKSFTLGTPIIQQYASSNCQKESLASSIPSFNYSIYKGGSTETMSLAKDLKMGERGLSIDFIDYAYTGQYTNLEAGYLAENGNGFVSLNIAFSYDKKYVRVCSENPTFTRGSIEATTLSSIASLLNAHEFYNLLETGTTLPHVTVNILPKLSFKIAMKVAQDAQENDTSGMLGSVPEKMNNKDIKYSLTDNAAWGLSDPTTDESGTEIPGMPEFFIFPQSQEAVSQDWFSSQPLWELPFVLHHEFGHHIFYTFFPKLFTDSYQLKEFSQKLGGNIFMRTGIKPVDHLLSGNYAPVTEVASAINEGFADLYAQYSLGGTTDIALVKCMNGTRDVSSKTFYDGVSKELSTTVWETFGAEQKEDDTGPFNIPNPEDINCAKYDFKDSHIIGAVLAHGVYALWEKTNLAKNDALGVKRGRALLEWISAQNSRISTYESGFSLMEIALKEAFALARENTDADGVPALCTLMQIKFPHFYAFWENNSIPPELSACFD